MSMPQYPVVAYPKYFMLIKGELNNIQVVCFYWKDATMSITIKYVNAFKEDMKTTCKYICYMIYYMNESVFTETVKTMISSLKAYMTTFPAP